MTYNDDRLGIIIQYPSNWKRIVDLDGLITFIAPWESDSATYPAGLGLGYKSYPPRICHLKLQECS
jgi:hypothetical protein